MGEHRIANKAGSITRIKRPWQCGAVRATICDINQITPITSHGNHSRREEQNAYQIRPADKVIDKRSIIELLAGRTRLISAAYVSRHGKQWCLASASRSSIRGMLVQTASAIYVPDYMMSHGTRRRCCKIDRSVRHIYESLLLLTTTRTNASRANSSVPASDITTPTSELFPLLVHPLT